MAESVQLRALIFGLDAQAKSVLSKVMPAEQAQELPYNLDALMDNPVTPSPHVILCGAPPAEIPLVEVAQALRMQYQDSPIFFVTSLRAGFERKIFQKNGFTDAFLLPLDNASLEEMMREEIAKNSGGKIKAYRSVKLIDIQPNQALDFDTYVYLPMNKKHIKFSAAGDELEQRRVDKLSKGDVNSIHVTTEQIGKFYKFSAQQLKNIGASTTMSETEKRDKMQTAIRDLMSGMFNDSANESSFEKGKGMMADCQQIVKSYVLDSTGEGKGWYDKLLALSESQATSYSHSAHVATLAALFGMGTGIGNPEHLAMAGILHDIGLADIPPEVQAKNYTDMTAEEKTIYSKHTELSAGMIKQRRMIVPEPVMTYILQHHERHDGMGYPNQIAHPKLKPESQILSLADRFDELTATVEGKKTLSPKEAMEFLKDPSKMGEKGLPWDTELVKKLTAVFKV